MLSDDFRFEGFDTRGWLNLLSLFSRSAELRSAEPGPDPRRHGTFVLVTDSSGTPCAGFVTDRGPVGADVCRAPGTLQERCARLGVERAVVLQEGAIEELTERAAERLGLDADYAAQWLTLIEAARELEDEGKIELWPRRSRLPLPTPVMLRRALDLVLPDERVIVAALWEDQDLWTACAIQRREGAIVRVVGPELLLEWTGPLGGDFRRDHRTIQRAIARAMGPLHFGLFAERQVVEALLRDPSPGAWARAIALREVIISPAPPYVHFAVGADAARAAGHRARAWLFGLDVYGYVAPAARFAREHVARIGSTTGILGFNPLQALAGRLRRTR
jgi:hypothetical protein